MGITKSIIGGTGVYSIYPVKRQEVVETDYGKVNINVIEVNGEEIAFMPRHGKEHSVPPHKVNYRANMMALKKIGVTHVYGMVTVGSIDEKINEGSIVVIDDFIDYTTRRVQTYYDDRAVHTDMSDPYCSSLRKAFVDQAKKMDLKIFESGVYVCTRGPRFETKAEIRMFQILGGTVCGMTNIPEVILAKELGICYSAIGMVSNMGCGIKKENLAEIDHGEVVQKAKADVAKALVEIFANNHLDQEKCMCKSATIDLSK